MTKITLQTGYNNQILRTVSESVKPHELRNYKKLADIMLKYIKNPKNGGV